MVDSKDVQTAFPQFTVNQLSGGIEMQPVRNLLQRDPRRPQYRETSFGGPISPKVKSSGSQTAISAFGGLASGFGKIAGAAAMPELTAVVGAVSAIADIGTGIANARTNRINARTRQGELTLNTEKWNSMKDTATRFGYASPYSLMQRQNYVGSLGGISVANGLTTSLAVN